MMRKKISKASLQRKFANKVEIKSIKQIGSEYWVDFKVKGKLGICNTSGKTMNELFDNILRISQYLDIK